MALAPEIESALAHLRRGSEGIDAVRGIERMDVESNRFNRALGVLAQLAETEQLPMAIVGGLAAIHYGHAAATQDIDIAIGKTDLKRLTTLAPSYGLKIAWESPKGWHTLVYGDVEINIVPEGGRAKDDSPTTIPSPQEMGIQGGLDYARLESWVELKISTNRQKDRGHVVEILKQTDTASHQQIAHHLEQVNQSYADSFSALRAQAIAEREQERKRR